MRWKAIFCAVVAVMPIGQRGIAQLAKPALSIQNLNWGWFDLQMVGNSVTPANTEWIIMEDQTIVFDSKREVGNGCDDPGPRSRIPNEFVADTRDLTLKHIIGCAPGKNYKALVRYNDGSSWSPVSDTAYITTPEEPVRSDDTIFVVLWGHSLLRYHDLCSTVTDIISNEDDGYVNLWGEGDAFGHALQTQLRRLTGKTVTVINGGVSGSLQYDWVRDGASSTPVSINLYSPGQQFSDSRRYPLAVFFFGQNDAREPFCGEPMTHPPAQYSEDADTIIERLTRQSVRVIYNSIHYATAVACPSETWEGALRDRQDAYYRSWDSLMSVRVPANGRLWRGLDLYNLFRSDTARFLCPDGIHGNLSEGVQGIVEPLATIIKAAIDSDRSVLSVSPVSSALSKAVFVKPMGRDLQQISFTLVSDEQVELTISDVLGRTLLQVAKRMYSAGEHAETISTASLASGTYYWKLTSADGIVTIPFGIKR